MKLFFRFSTVWQLLVDRLVGPSPNANSEAHVEGRAVAIQVATRRRPMRHGRLSTQRRAKRCAAMGPRYSRKFITRRAEREVYRPKHALSRYCSSGCVTAATRWRQCAANRRYRASEQGKARRRDQACRYRRRVRERVTTSAPPSAGGEGYGYAGGWSEFRCRRPGCYETFLRTARSPLQTFCNALCRQALYRVIVRERRWRQRRQGGPSQAWRSGDG